MYARRCLCLVFFFKQKTAYEMRISDWSSDVCSSDLGDAFVSEVDESDGSIALYRPQIAVLNNVSLDHKSLDELRALFGDFIGHAGRAVINMDNDEGAALATALPLERRLTVAIDGDADLIAANLDPRPFGIDFDLVERGEPPLRVSLQVPGRQDRKSTRLNSSH